MRTTWIVAWAFVLVVAARGWAGEPLAFRVSLDAKASERGMSGRLVVFLLREGARGVWPGATPADAPFYDDPQPIYAMNVRDVGPGAEVVIDDAADAFPARPSELPRGTYRVQAVLDASRSNSDWSREPGNVYSEVVTLERVDAPGGQTVSLSLTKRVEEEREPADGGYEIFRVESKLLSEFHGRPVRLRAGVVRPKDFDERARYPAVYVVPGFGGDHTMARRYATMQKRGIGDADLARSAFTIVLDPESGNGHTLFADSDNNGPVGRALVEELIPALEARYPLVREPSARVVTGHSSGGWSSLWLAVTYPGTFGACWSGAPDPVDFRAFQKINLYEKPNFFTDEQGKDIASNYQGGMVLMTLRQENQWEQVRGPGNTSGAQWDSWQAVFGPRDEKGDPAALFDPQTGVIDRRIADAYKAFDINDRLLRDPETYVPRFRDHVRIVVGDKDEWNLHAAVKLLRDRLAEMGLAMDGVGSFGKITIVPGTDHGSVTMSEPYRAMSREMFEWFAKNGHAR